MKKIYLYTSALVLICFLSCCTEETTHSRTYFPDLLIYSYAFKDEGGYTFLPSSNEYRNPIKDYNENIPYISSTIYFQGYAHANISLIDKKIKEDIKNDLYDKYPEYVDGVDVSVNFVDEQIENFKIYSDGYFNNIKPGESLNHLFKITTRLVVLNKNGRYVISDGDIADIRRFNNTFVPYDIKIEFKTPPLVSGKYSFFLDLLTEKKTYSSKIATVTLVD